MKEGGGFEKLLKNETFTSRIISVIWDEAHCISTWGEMRTAYREAGRLRAKLASVPYLVTSATLPPLALAEVMENLKMKKERTISIHRSNDRPNVHLVVRKIRYPLNTFLDLVFLVPEGWKAGDRQPPKFLIFFDSIPDSIAAAKVLRNRLPLEYQNKIKWFNSDMSEQFRECEVDALRVGKTWGLCCTDSFGMVYIPPTKFNVILIASNRVLTYLT